MFDFHLSVKHCFVQLCKFCTILTSLKFVFIAQVYRNRDYLHTLVLIKYKCTAFKALHTWCKVFSICLTSDLLNGDDCRLWCVKSDN